jgi:outer membrane protein assembly factor BamB
MFDRRRVWFGIALFIAGIGLAQDKSGASAVEAWTRFRGPNGSGISLATNIPATSTPAMDRNHVFFYWTTPDEITLLALDHDGKETWRRNLGPFTSQHGSGTSPIVIGDLILVNNDQEGKSSLIGLDSTTGSTRWQIERPTNQSGRYKILNIV